MSVMNGNFLAVILFIAILVFIFIGLLTAKARKQRDTVPQPRTLKLMIWRRFSCGDGHVCKACKKADGSIISGPEEDLRKICTSRYGCRCGPFSDMDEAVELKL